MLAVTLTSRRLSLRSTITIDTGKEAPCAIILCYKGGKFEFLFIFYIFILPFALWRLFKVSLLYVNVTAVCMVDVGLYVSFLD